MSCHISERQLQIAQNIKSVQSRIRVAAERSGRLVEDITLVCVTKSQTVSDMEAAVACGVHDIGENRVQEFMKKHDFFMEKYGSEIPRFHLIGHLQTNKVKYIINRAALIHSVDSTRLAAEVSKHSSGPVSILLEVNMEAEDTKFGFSPSETREKALEIAKMNNIIVSGLMTVAPNVEFPEDNRACFRKMRELFVDIQIALSHDMGSNMRYLSMGMTNDYEVAIEEGSNLVRIGTGIFSAGLGQS